MQIQNAVFSLDNHSPDRHRIQHTDGALNLLQSSQDLQTIHGGVPKWNIDRLTETCALIDKTLVARKEIARYIFSFFRLVGIAEKRKPAGELRDIYDSNLRNVKVIGKDSQGYLNI